MLEEANGQNAGRVFVWSSDGLYLQPHTKGVQGQRHRIWRGSSLNMGKRSGAWEEGPTGTAESGAQAGQGTGETNGVTGVGDCSNLGPMGIRERENILGKSHIGETRVVWTNGPIQKTELGYININLQRTVGRSLSSPCLNVPLTTQGISFQGIETAVSERGSRASTHILASTNGKKKIELSQKILSCKTGERENCSGVVFLYFSARQSTYIYYVGPVLNIFGCTYVMQFLTGLSSEYQSIP